MVFLPCRLMKNHGQGKNETLGCAHSRTPKIWGLGFLSSLLLRALGSPTVKWAHWSRSSRRCHLALVICEDDASFLLRGSCTDKGSHTSWAQNEEEHVWSKIFDLPWKEREKDKSTKTDLKYMSPPIFLFSCFPFLCPPLILYLYHLCPTFPFCWWWSSFLPLFLILGFLPFVRSIPSSFFLPIHKWVCPHWKDALLFPSLLN